MLDHLIDELVVILCRAPPKAKHLFFCQVGPSNALQNGIQIFLSYHSHGISPVLSEPPVVAELSCAMDAEMAPFLITRLG
jgi:hypothetical protein